MTSRVLVEGHNLSLAAGTGIATYARVLAQTLRRLGYSPEVLLGTRRHIDGKDPVLSEVGFYDALAELPRPLPQKISLELRRLIGMPLGIKPITIRRTGSVVDPSPGRFADFTSIHGVRDLLDKTRFHFKRYGRRVQVRVKEQPALFHATHPIPMTVAGCPNIYTIHDLVPLRLPYATLDEKKYFLQVAREICRTADHIVTVSEASKRDIVTMLDVPERRITNTYQSVRIPEALLLRTRDEVALEIERFFELEYGDYFLFVGAIEPKKNISRLIDAYASSGSKRPLVIVGTPAWQFESDMERIADEKFLTYRMADGVIKPQRRVRRMAYLPFARLIALMRGARAVLFPSLYEGFGLPVLEAMLCGAPVLTSNTASLPEIAGDAALLVDPFDVDAIAEGIRELDNDAGLRSDLTSRGRARARKFSPEIYQTRVQDLYSKVIHGRAPRSVI